MDISHWKDSESKLIRSVEKGTRFIRIISSWSMIYTCNQTWTLTSLNSFECGKWTMDISMSKILDSSLLEIWILWWLMIWNMETLTLISQVTGISISLWSSMSLNWLLKNKIRFSKLWFKISFLTSLSIHSSLILNLFWTLFKELMRWWSKRLPWSRILKSQTWIIFTTREN